MSRLKAKRPDPKLGTQQTLNVLSATYLPLWDMSAKTGVPIAQIVDALVRAFLKDAGDKILAAESGHDARVIWTGWLVNHNVLGAPK